MPLSESPGRSPEARTVTPLPGQKQLLRTPARRPYISPEITAEAKRVPNMSSFDDRQRGEEARYALDQETQFKVNARRNRLLGLWTAELLGLSGPEAEAYAREVVIADLEEAGDGDVVRKVQGDLQKAGISRSEAQIREEMARLLPIAREQITKDITG